MLIMAVFFIRESTAFYRFQWNYLEESKRLHYTLCFSSLLKIEIIKIVHFCLSTETEQYWVIG